MGFGARLTALRKMRKMTQEELANNIHSSRRSIQNYENDNRNVIPGTKVISALADALQVDMAALLDDDVCKTYVIPYKKMLSSIDNTVSEYKKIEEKSIKIPNLGSTILLSSIDPIIGLATVGGTILPQGIYKLIANKKKQSELKDKLRVADRSCIMETYNCRTAIIKNQQRYNRKIELSDDSNDNDDIIKTIIEIIFAYQECMMIWFEQHLLFSECLRVLDDTKDTEARLKIEMHINSINREDKDKEDILKKIMKLEAHLQEIGG